MKSFSGLSNLWPSPQNETSIGPCSTVICDYLPIHKEMIAPTDIEMAGREIPTSSQLDVLADTSSLMDRWNIECFLGSATPVDIVVKLCEVSDG